MKNGYFELGYLLLIVGFGTFDWIERSRERMEAVAPATHLRAFLTEGLGSEAKDFQALSDIGDIEHFIQWESGGVYVVVYTILALFALRAFVTTDLCSVMTAAFTRAWTWRP